MSVKKWIYGASFLSLLSGAPSCSSKYNNPEDKDEPKTEVASAGRTQDTIMQSAVGNREEYSVDTTITWQQLNDLVAYAQMNRNYDIALIFEGGELMLAKTNEQRAVVCYHIGTTYQAMGKYDKAKKFLELSQKINQSDVTASMRRTQDTIVQDGVGNAVSGGIEGYPIDTTVTWKQLNDMVCSAQANHDYDLALILGGSGLISAKNDEQRALVCYNIGNTYMAMAEYDKAKKFLELAQKINETDVAQKALDEALLAQKREDNFWFGFRLVGCGLCIVAIWAMISSWNATRMKAYR